MKLPITLPEGWTAQSMIAFGVVITADNRRGYVTVDERLRAFETGMTAVRKRGHVDYAGRNWKTRLYSDAVATLQAAINYPERPDDAHDYRD